MRPRKAVLFAKREVKQIIVQCGVQITILSVLHRNATTAAHVCDHDVEMELDAERRKRLTSVQVQRHR